MPVTVGNLIAKIIGAGDREIVMQQNVSICQQIVLSCFDWTQKRNKIVSEAMNFPSNMYNYERLSARFVQVPSPDGMTIPLESMLDAIDEETALVSVSHVLFRSSFSAGPCGADSPSACEVGAKSSRMSINRQGQCP